MIRPLRRRHLWMWLVVALVTGVLAVLGLARRPEKPVMDSLPAALAIAAEGAASGEPP